MVDINALSPEQIAQLEQQLEAKKRNEEQRKNSEKQTYSHLKDVTVEKVFARLQKISGDLERSKVELYQEFNSLLELKNGLYGTNEKQLSHSWSNADASVTIITGFNTIDVWDETKSVGLTKVNNWLDSQINEGNKKFVGLVRELLKPNANGDLKANRVLDLQNQADVIGDPELIEAVKLLREAHRSEKSATYIKAQYKDANGEKKWLPLALSSV